MSTSSTARPVARGVSALPGCYIFALGAGLLIATLVWAGYTFLRQVDELAAFTDPEPAALAVAAPAPAELEDLARRLSAFAEAASSGQAADLTLTMEDVNAMLGGFPRLADMKPLLVVRRLGPDATFTADISFPMNSLPGRRRHLNGSLDGRFGLHPEAGLFVSVLDVRVPGRTVPPGFLEVYQRGIIPGKNFGFLDDMLVRNFREDPVFAEPLHRIASLQSAEGSLTLSAKAQTNPPARGASPISPIPTLPPRRPGQKAIDELIY